MVQQQRELLAQPRPEELEGRWTGGGRDHGERGIAQLEAALYRGSSRHRALHRDDGLRVQPGEPARQGRVLYNRLRDAPGVPYEQEADAAHPAEPVQPAGQPHALACVPADLGGPDT